MEMIVSKATELTLEINHPGSPEFSFIMMIKVIRKRRSSILRSAWMYFLSTLVEKCSWFFYHLHTVIVDEPHAPYSRLSVRVEDYKGKFDFMLASGQHDQQWRSHAQSSPQVSPTLLSCQDFWWYWNFFRESRRFGSPSCRLEEERSLFKKKTPKEAQIWRGIQPGVFSHVPTICSTENPTSSPTKRNHRIPL